MNKELRISENQKEKHIYDLEERLINFSTRIIDVVNALPNNRIGYHIAGQLIHSGTSPKLDLI